MLFNMLSKLKRSPLSLVMDRNSRYYFVKRQNHNEGTTFGFDEVRGRPIGRQPKYLFIVQFYNANKLLNTIIFIVEVHVYGWGGGRCI